MIAIAPKYRKSAALFLLALVIAFPVAAVVLIIEHHYSNAEEIGEIEAQIARFEAVARYRPELAAMRENGPEAAYAAWFLPGGDPAIAAAGLQAKLKELAQAHGVDVAQARDLKSRTIEGVTYVGIGLEMTGGAEGMRDLLVSVEQGVPLLMIDEAQIHGELSGADPRYDPVLLYAEVKVWGALAGSVAPAAKEANP